MHRIGRTIVICFFLGAACLAQQNPPDAPSTAAQSSDSTSPQGKLAFVELVRQKSRVFPDLATNATRLSPWQKFQLAANNSVSPPTFGIAIISAAWGQALDRPYGYGEGGEAFGKRFGANMARSASDNFFGTFLVASILGEDPRFYVRRHLSFKQTLKYAAVRVAVTRNDSGDRTVNFAGLLGPLASESLANTYYPEGNRGPTSTFSRYGSDLAWKFGGNILRQYWPAINKKLRIMPPAHSEH
jgi:hypothetical protein